MAEKTKKRENTKNNINSTKNNQDHDLLPRNEECIITKITSFFLLSFLSLPHSLYKINN